MKKEKTKKYYLSGKISGLSEYSYIRNFNNAYSEVLFYDEFDRNKDSIINPLLIEPFLGIKSHVAYMIADLYELRKCTHCVMQANWINSRGACIEHYFAKFVFKLKIIYI